MRVIRSSRQASVVLGLAALSTLGATVSNRADAATFPVHGFFWSDTATPPATSPGLNPHADWRFCKDGADSCGFELLMPNTWAYARPGFYRVNTSLALDSIYFATPYGASDAYCTVGGSLNFSKEINCSRATNLSVRYIGNNRQDFANWQSTAWRGGGSGDAAVGFVDNWWTPAMDTLLHGVSFNSRGQPNVVTKPPGTVGIYKITIPGMGARERSSSSSDGVAHVQAVTMRDNPFEQKRICGIETVVDETLADANALEITLRCFGRHETREGTGFGGSTALTPMDSPFVFSYEMPGGSLLRSVFSDRTGVVAAVGYEPTHASHAGIRVRGTGQTGRYVINFPSTVSQGTNVQVTPRRHGPNYCNVENWSPDSTGSGTNVSIGCFEMTANGPLRANMPFYLGYYSRR